MNRAAAYFVAIATLLAASPAFAYLGPGAGFAFVGNLSLLAVSVVIVLAGLLSWPLRYWLRRRRALPLAWRRRIRRAVIIGLDGLDPDVTQRLLRAGRLPHLAKLQALGFFRPLATTCPAISPVAWSSFATGTNPAKHGIFDFLSRDEDNYSPTLSSAEVLPPAKMLDFLGWRIPLSRPRLRLLQKSTPFWAILGKHDVPCTILRLPITFPPEPFARGMLLSAMCVPDLEGTQGTFKHYTSEAQSEAMDPLASAAVQGSGDVVRLRFVGDTAASVLEGPPNPLRQDGRRVKLPFTVQRTPGESRAWVRIGRERVALEVGRFSEWITLSFPLGFGLRLKGLCRLRLTRAWPEVSLYVSPLSIDPVAPALPISHPRFFAVFLAKLIGRFNTLGLAEDTGALNQGVLDEAGFLEQAWANHGEREAMFFAMLERCQDGVLTCVFDATDRIQHMFSRPEQGRVIEETYERADALVGRAMAAAKASDPSTLFAVLSDHGFKAFRRGVNLNVWLYEHGYIALKPGAVAGASDWLADVDWAKTRAYGLGLAGIYLNTEGREAQGIVPPGEARTQLARELCEKLAGLVDPGSGEVAIAAMHFADDVYRGPYRAEAPDLVVGYASGYRVSWESARGRVGGALCVDNDKAWSGDHCIDPALVPGVLFANQAFDALGDAPAIIDLAPTLLSLFGVAPPPHMDGRSLVSAGAPQ